MANKNLYYLTFKVRGKAKPKDLSLFSSIEDESKYFDVVYQMKPGKIGKRIEQIDLLTNPYLCEEDFIMTYFDHYNPEQKNVFVSIELKKNEYYKSIYIDPLYHSEMMYPILKSISKDGKLYTTTPSYLHYKDIFYQWLDDKTYFNSLLQSGKIGKKLKEELRKYNGYPKDSYKLSEMMKSYQVLRGTYIVAKDHFSYLKEEQQTNHEKWEMLYDEHLIRQEKLQHELNQMNYIDRLQYLGELKNFYEGIKKGSCSLKNLPLTEAEQNYYQQKIARMNYLTKKEKEEQWAEICYGIQTSIEKNEKIEKSKRQSK